MFKTKIKENGAEMTVVLIGELDTAASKSFTVTMEKEILPCCGKAVTLDFSALEFISSSGLRQLLVIRKEAGRLGGSIRSTGMKEDILEIFKLSGLDTMFGIQ